MRQHPIDPTPTDDEGGEFEGFIADYQEALASGRPLPDPSRLQPQHLLRWPRMRLLIHQMHGQKRPASAPPDPDGASPSTSRPCPDLWPQERENQTDSLHVGTSRDVQENQPPPGPPAVPGYEVLSEVGRGGMGVVYKARHRSLNRVVALKMVVTAELATPEQLLRFQLEAELAARVSHPNVVIVHEVGRAGGRPFLAMEWVEGGTLAQKIRTAGTLPPREAAGLVAVLAGAVHAAHCQGVIHRDLKPANVLLTAEGQPKIADFGLAKPLAHAPGLTATGAILGTPEYMAPEQAGLDGRDVGPACDVHALGAILYELLTGRPPFRGAWFFQTVELVCNEEPASPRTFVAHLPLDLETVCLKCLRKEPQARYPTSQALAEDLRRFLDGEPVSARPVGRGERAWRWARRHPSVASLLACVVALLVGGSVVSTWFGLDARDQARQANQARDAARTAETAAQDEKRTAELRAAELTFRLGLQQAEAGAVDRGLFLMLRAWRQAPEDAVGFRAVIRANLAGWSRQLPRLRQVVHAGEPGVYCAIGSGDPDGRTFLAWPGRAGTRCFDSATGRPVDLASLRKERPMLSLSPNGRWLCLYEEGYCVYDAQSGKEAPGLSPRRDWEFCYRFDALEEVAFNDKPGNVRGFWDLRSGKPFPGQLPLANGDDCRLTRTADGRPVAVVFRGIGLPAGQHEVRALVFDPATGKTLSPPPSLAGGPSPHVSYDGRAALFERAGAWQWVDLATNRSQALPWRSRRAAGGDGNQQPDILKLGRDALGVLSGESDGRLRGYDLASGLQRGGDLHQWSGSVGAVDQSADGRLVFTLSQDGTARVWDTSLCQLQPTHSTIPRRRLENKGGVYHMHQALSNCYSADGSRIVLTQQKEGYALLMNARTGDLLGPPLRQPLLAHAVFSPDGRYLATAPTPHTGAEDAVSPVVVLRDGHTGSPIGKAWTSPKLIHALAFSADGKSLAVGGVGGTFILDVPAHTLRHTLPEATCVCGLRWNADNRRLLVVARGGWAGVGSGLRVWDAQAGQAIAPFRQVPRYIVASWRGRPGQSDVPQELACWNEPDRSPHRLSADAAQTLSKPDPDGPAAVHLHEFSLDGNRMASCTSSNKVRQWDVQTGKTFGPSLDHSERVHHICYSPDGKVLAASSLDETVRLWDADTGWPLGPPLAHASMPYGLAFDKAGALAMCTTEAGVVHTWPVPRPVLDDPDRFEVWMRARGGVRLEGEEPIQLTLAEWQTACRSLTQRWPEADPAVAEVPDDLEPWHRRRALDAEEAGSERGELYHLTRLAMLCPREEAVRARMARLHARVAGRLPAGPARDHEWKLAQDAARWEKGWPDEGHWARCGALEATARKSFEEALWYLDRLAERGGDWSVFADRADVHGRRGKQTQREADLKRALELGGDRQRDFVLKVADEWARQGRWPEAARLLNKAQEQAPTDTNVFAHLALALLAADDRAGHARLCQAALRSLPRLPTSNNSLLDFTRIVAAVRAAWSAEAVDDWKQPLALLDEAYRLLKSLEGKGGGHEHSLRPLWRELLTAKGAVLHRAGRHADAVAQLEQAMKLAPGGEGGPEEWAWLALAYAATEKAPRERAQGWLDRARAAMPKRDGGGLWEAVRVELLVAEASRTLGKSEQQ